MRWALFLIVSFMAGPAAAQGVPACGPPRSGQLACVANRLCACRFERGGALAGQILTCMEAALNKTATEYSRYGSTTHKQVYIYGGLDPRPTEFQRSFGMAWGMGGWLLFPFLQKIGVADAAKLRARVAAELKTTFASHYTKVISLQEVLQLDILKAYYRRATGEKFLINPHKAG